MRDIVRDVRKRGVAKTSELLRDGYTSHQLTRAVRAGIIIRIRQGHYCCPGLSVTEQQAYRVGGRVTGATGARLHGFWSPPTTNLDVAVDPHARALRTRVSMRDRLAYSENPTGTTVHWTDSHRLGTRTLADPIDCVREVAERHPAIDAFACAESAIAEGYISGSAWLRQVDAHPYWHPLLRLAGRNSESGGESMIRFRLLTEAIVFTQQVVIAGVGRVDFMIGDGLVIEVDGAEFHVGRQSFEDDRKRDAALTALGFRVLRFSYSQVRNRWPEVAAAIHAALLRGDHQRP